MRIEDEKTLKKLVMVLVIIMMISIFMWLSSCGTSNDEMCGTCRIYVYEYDGFGNFRKATTDEKIFCGEYYKSGITTDTLEDGWMKQVQKDCY